MVLRRLIKWIRIIAGYRQVEQLLRHLAMITEQAGEGIIVTDLEGSLRFVNTTWARMHGYGSSSELVGKHISLFHTKEQIKDSMIPFTKAAKSKGRCSGQAGHVRRDGTTFQTQMKMTVVNDKSDKAIGFMVLVTDITKHRQLEESLRQGVKQAGELREQIEQLRHQINEHEQAEERLTQQAAESASANEQLRHQINENEQAGETLRQSTPQAKELEEETAPPLDDKKLKELSEMAKRLAYPR